MGELLVTGSVLAAFFAGAVALFSPCCIVFLLPAYLAAAVKSRRWRLLPLTLVFAIGLATVLVPVTLGIGLVSAAVGRFHVPLYLAGGSLMIALGGLALVGRSWRLPSFVRAPDVRRSDAPGIFALGVFSGVASSCCAPVLAGVMVLSALSSSLGGSVALGLAYVFGMATPLLLLALLWDRLRLGERASPMAKVVRIRLGRRSFVTNTLNVAVAGAFFAMGIGVWVLALTGNTTAAPGAQLAIGRWLSGVLGRLTAALDPVPEPVLAAALLALAVAFTVVAVRGRPTADGERASEGVRCHDTGQEHEDEELEGRKDDTFPGRRGARREGDLPPPPPIDGTASPIGDPAAPAR